MTHPDLVFYGAVPWIIGHAVGAIANYVQWSELDVTTHAEAKRHKARWAVLWCIQLAIPYAAFLALRTVVRELAEDAPSLLRDAGILKGPPLPTPGDLSLPESESGALSDSARKGDE